MGAASCPRWVDARSPVGRCATRGPRSCSCSPPHSARSPQRMPRRGRGARPTRPRSSRGRMCASSPGRSPRCPIGRSARRCAAFPASRPPRRSWRRASASAPRCVTARSWGSTARRWPTSFASRTRRARTPPAGLLQSLAEGRPAAPGLAVADGTSRLSVVIDSTFTAEEGFETVPPGYEGLGVAARGRRRRREDHARRGHARRRSGSRGRDPSSPSQPPGSTGALTPPVHVLAIELELSLTGLPDTLASGVITVRALGTSPDPAGDSWTDTALEDISPQSWTIDDGGGGVPYEPAQPGELVVPIAGPSAGTGVAALLRPCQRSGDRGAREPGVPRAHGRPRGRHARGEHLRPARHDPPAAARSTGFRPSRPRSRCSSSMARRWISPATPAA